MDTAVALVQAYLQVNGYFTVAEYPILECFGNRPSRTITDIDIMGLRFPGAGASMAGGVSDGVGVTPFFCDPILKVPNDVPDMLVGEVKEGRAEFNPAMRDPEVLATTLARFGCCHPAHAKETAVDLLRHGRARTHVGHLVRLAAFGSTQEPMSPRCLVVPLQHVIEFLRDYVHSHWDSVKHLSLKDSTLGLIALMEKAKGPTNSVVNRSAGGGRHDI